jgi:hypothetical protein
VLACLPLDPRTGERRKPDSLKIDPNGHPLAQAAFQCGNSSQKRMDEAQPASHLLLADAIATVSIACNQTNCFEE